jgi:hypothetical protein
MSRIYALCYAEFRDLLPYLRHPVLDLFLGPGGPEVQQQGTRLRTLFLPSLCGAGQAKARSNSEHVSTNSLINSLLTH